MTMFRDIGRATASRRTGGRIGTLAAIVLALAGPLDGSAASASDEAFRQFLIQLCSGAITQPPGTNWDAASLASLCSATGNGAGGGPGTTASNLGTTNAGSGLTLRKKNAARDRLDEDEAKPPKGASADGGRWGLLVAPQYGKGDRVATERENGFKSDLKGLSLGVDYRMSDALVFGVLAGHVRDDAKFLGDAGSIEARTSSLHAYGTWLPSDRSAVDAYLGVGRIDLDSSRRSTFLAINELAHGSVSGQQILGGVGASYNRDLRPINFAVSANLDALQTRFDAYKESGSLVALRFAERTTRSVTATLGVGVAAPRGFDWGSLTPSIRIAAVHEFQNDARPIRNELVSAPGVGISVETDEPDRDYGLATLSLVAARHGGTQLFLNYEQRFGDRLFDAWALGAGVLLEF